MRLAQIRIENFRSIKDETIAFNDYTCLVGPNGSGKSTVLAALNIFFRNTTSTVTNVLYLAEEDFHHRDTSKPARITLTFEDLSADAQRDFSGYYRQGKLVVFARAAWDPESGRAEVKQYGSRLAIEQFAPYFKASGDKAKVADLREIYQKLRKAFPDLPNATTGTAMSDALHSYEENHSDKCTLIDSEDQFYGVSKGANRLAKHIQWVYVPAVKEPSTEQEESAKTALGQLLQRTVRTKLKFDDQLNPLKEELAKKYEEVIEGNKDALANLQDSLQARLREWSNPGAKLSIDWRYDPEKSVVVNQPVARVSIGEDQFIGEVARLGHGLQRAFLVSLLQELATGVEGNAPTLLLGFEEPELYLHPPQAQHVANLLERLARKHQHKSQILVTTHCPYFVSSRGFENVRMFRKDSTRRFITVTSTTYQDVEALLAASLSEKPGPPSSLMARIEQIMQPSLRELFFTNQAVLVEGLEDVALISTYLHLAKMWDTFRQKGCHFVVCDGKTNMSRPLAIAIRLGIPAFVVFDSDTDATNPDDVNNNKRDNACLLRLSRFVGVAPSSIDLRDVAPVPDDQSLSAESIWFDRAVMFSPRLPDVVKAELGGEWDAAERQARRKHGFVENVRQKNAMLLTATLEQLWDEWKRCAVLNKLCESIIKAAS